MPEGLLAELLVPLPGGAVMSADHRDHVSELAVLSLELAMIEVELAEITAAVKKMAGYLDADEVDS